MCAWVRHSLAVGCGALLISTSVPAGSRTTLSVGRPYFEQTDDGHGVRFRWRGSVGYAELFTGGLLKLAAGGSAGEVIRLNFPGASRFAEPVGERQKSGIIRYYTGKDAATGTLFDKVRYRNLYPGIDLVFRTEAGKLEYDLELAPRADPASIRVRFEGGRTFINPDGDIETVCGRDVVVQRKPSVFQQMASGHVRVSSAYTTSANGEFGIALLDRPTRDRGIVIDPVLEFTNIMGGEGFESIYAIATGSDGDIYVTGETDSLSFTGRGRRNSRDVFVARLKGQELVYLVYLGGASGEVGRGIAVDAYGNAYVTGTTVSVDFPTTPGALTIAKSGLQKPFVCKLDSSGLLAYSTYLGSSGSDWGFGIAVDSAGAAFIAGQTNSSTFPVSSGAFRSATSGGQTDCFVAKLNPAGNAVLYSAILGGRDLDLCSGIALDSQGNAYVVGTTYSPDFPVVNALQPVFGGRSDVFVAKLNSTGTALSYSTFVGGSSKQSMSQNR